VSRDGRDDRTEEAFLSTGRKLLLVVVVMAVPFWYFWPQISQIGMLSAPEKELHGYFKNSFPPVRASMQEFEQLQKDPSNAELREDLVKSSEEVLSVNHEYWVVGSAGESVIRRVMNKIRGVDAESDRFLATWEGPEKDPDALDSMRDDTRTLAYHSWYYKEDSNRFAEDVLSKLADAPGQEASMQEVSDDLKELKESHGQSDFIYRKWKGSYRPPLSMSQ
jgi:hypothetical protein